MGSRFLGALFEAQNFPHSSTYWFSISGSALACVPPARGLASEPENEIDLHAQAVKLMSTEQQSNGQDTKEGSPQPQLRRRLGILNATSINMSNMIGIGPFITVPIILGTMGGPQALLAWFAGAVLAIADGLVISELGAALPGSGGTYVFLRDS